MSERTARLSLGHRLTLALILAGFVALGLGYTVIVPLFEKPDEPLHFFFVKALIDERALPVMDESETALWAQEGSQPPLYYAIAALTLSWIDVSDAEQLYWLNPQRNWGNPGNPSNKNTIVHTEQEAWPAHAAALAVRVARVLSLVCGLGTVVMTFLIARQGFPARPQVALGAAAINAFIPQFLFISSSVSNDSLITFLSACALLQLCLLLNRPRRGPGSYLVLGVTVGLAAITKLSGLTLLALSGLALAWQAWRQRSWRPLWAGGSIVIMVTVAIAGWWYLRNLSLYGDLSGLAPHLVEMGGRRELGALTIQRIWSEFLGLRASFWGLFGWFSILMPTWVYRLLDLVTAVGVIGLIGHLRERENRSSAAGRTILVSLAWFAMVAVALLRWTTMTKGSQGRLLFPAISVVALALAVGWAHLLAAVFGRRRSDQAGGVLAVGLLSLSLAALIWIIPPAYERPLELERADLPAGLAALNWQFGDEIHLYGCETDRDALQPGDVLEITCYWEALRPIRTNYYFFHHVLGRDLVPVGKEDGYPGSGALPTSLWPVGPVIAATARVRIGSDVAAPALGQVTVGVYDAQTREHLTPVTSEGHPLALAIAAQVKIAPPERQKVPIPNPIHYAVGELAILSGFEIDQETLSVTLYWRVPTTPSVRQDYTVFVHLLDESGVLQGQGDGQPVDGQYPSRLWEAGETIVDRHLIQVNTGAPPGRYQLSVGLYDPVDGVRLPVRDAAGVVQPGDRILLPTTFEYAPPTSFWRLGDLSCDTYRIPVTTDLSARRVQLW